MLRNKRIIIIFCVLLFISIAAVLTSVLFTVGEIEVVCASKPEYLNINEEELKEDIDINYSGKNIIFLDTKSLINQVEKDFPNVKVLNVERVFPKKVIITVKERLEVYCFTKGGKYIYTDFECKVLRISDTKSDIYSGKVGQVIDVDFNPKNITSYQSGEIMNFIEHDAAQFLTQLFLCSTENKDEVFFRNYIQNVDMTWFFLPLSTPEVLIKLSTGAEFTYYYNGDFVEKMILYMNKLVENDDSTLPQIDRISGRYLFSYTNGKIVFTDKTNGVEFTDF